MEGLSGPDLSESFLLSTVSLPRVFFGFFFEGGTGPRRVLRQSQNTGKLELET